MLSVRTLRFAKLIAMDISGIVKEFGGRFTSEERRVYNLSGSSMGLYLALRKEPFLMVADTEEAARKLHCDALFYMRLLGINIPIYLIPPSNGPETAGERAAFVHRINSSGSVIACVEAMEEPLYRPEKLDEIMLRLSVSMEVERASIEQKLHKLGYERTGIVSAKGQYSMRGYILDVFPCTGDAAYRIEFFGDVIEGIKTLDIETQRSHNRVDDILLLPAVGPEEGVTPAELLQGHRCFYSEGHGPISEEATALSALALAGEGVDAGLLPLGGLGIMPEERKSIYELAPESSDVRPDKAAGFRLSPA